MAKGWKRLGGERGAVRGTGNHGATGAALLLTTVSALALLMPPAAGAGRGPG